MAPFGHNVAPPVHITKKYAAQEFDPINDPTIVYQAHHNNKLIFTKDFVPISSKGPKRTSPHSVGASAYADH